MEKPTSQSKEQLAPRQLNQLHSRREELPGIIVPVEQGRKRALKVQHTPVALEEM